MSAKKTKRRTRSSSGRDGVIRFKQIGPSSYELLTDQIQRLLNQRE